MREKLLILIVEDDKVFVQILTEYLIFKGFRVVSSYYGIEATSLAKKDKPDVIIIDIRLPDINGIEVIRQIRAIHMHKKTPIISFTGLISPDIHNNCITAGADYHFTKPVGLPVLFEKIVELLKS